MKGLHLLTILGCLVAGFTLMEAFTAQSAPTQGAGAALAVACAVIPYCFVRSITLWVAPTEIQLRRLNETMEAHTKLLKQIADTRPESDSDPTTQI